MDVIKYFFISELSSVTQLTTTDQQLCTQVSCLQLDLTVMGQRAPESEDLGSSFVSLCLHFWFFPISTPSLLPHPYSTYNCPSQVPTLENIVKKP